MTTPCQDCPNCVVGCHGDCPRYAAYRADRDAQAARRVERIQLAEPTEGARRAIRRKEKRRLQNR